MMLKAIAADARDKTIDACCEVVGIERRWLRDKAMRWALCANPSELAAGDYAKALRSFIEQLAWPVKVNAQNLGSIMKAVPSAKWATLHEANRTDGLPWSSIHGVKGQEFNGVAVILPERLTTSVNGHTVLDFWENDAEAEPRRVLYVAASRAQELLILAVHEKHVARVEATLRRDSVPYERWVVRQV
jgi:DNA helicase-2/ATP-dependent DNA helicase PcrA